MNAIRIHGLWSITFKNASGSSAMITCPDLQEALGIYDRVRHRLTREEIDVAGNVTDEEFNEKYLEKSK